MNLFENSDYFDDNDGFENMDEKVRYYQKMIRGHYNKTELPDIDIIESLVDYCVSVDRFSDALEFCHIWLIHDPTSATAYHKMAIVLMQLNKTKEALKNIDIAIDYDPLFKDAVLIKAIIMEQLGKVDEGIELVNDLLKDDPGNEDALFRKAMLLQSALETEEALNILQYLENMDYLPIEVYQELAHCYHLLGDYAMSAEYYEKAIELAPFDYLIWYNYGVMYGHKGANYKAIDCYKMVLTLKNDFVPALFNLGNTYTVTSRLIEAIETYKELLKYAPDDLETLHNLASTYADNKQYLSSIEYYSKVINIDPINHQAFFARGYCYDLLEDFDNALSDYNTALIFTPSSKNILQQKADLLYNFGKIRESLDCYLKVYELDPNDEHAIYDVAFIYFELGKLDYAEVFLIKVIEISYSYSDAWFLLAKIYAIKGNEKKSLKYLAESIRLDTSKYDDFLVEFDVLVDNFKKFQRYLGRLLTEKKVIV